MQKEFFPELLENSQTWFGWPQAVRAQGTKVWVVDRRSEAPWLAHCISQPPGSFSYWCLPFPLPGPLPFEILAETTWRPENRVGSLTGDHNPLRPVHLYPHDLDCPSTHPGSRNMSGLFLDKLPLACLPKCKITLSVFFLIFSDTPCVWRFLFPT